MWIHPTLLLAALAACSDPAPSPPEAAGPPLISPFAGQFPAVGVFDHAPDSGGQQAFWGATLRGRAGHTGYDWAMPLGTPVLAASDGLVARAGTDQPFTCVLTGRTVEDQLTVRVHHHQGGRRVLTAYTHLSAIEVQEGDRVSAGQRIGLSGDTGCAAGPHLHFSTWLDPAGPPRELESVDPWAADLWKAPPALYRTRSAPQLSGGPLIRTVRLWGTGDMSEGVEVVAAGSDLTDVTGWTVVTTRSRKTLAGPLPQWVPAELLDDGDCARLLDPSGVERARLGDDGRGRDGCDGVP